MDQKRVLLAFLLMTAVLVASQWWYSRLAPPPDASGPGDVAGEVVTDTVVHPPAPGPEPGPELPPVPPDTAGPVAVDTIIESDTGVASNRLLEDRLAPGRVRVETPLYVAEIDPAGGVIHQVSLRRYVSFVDSGPVRLVPEGAAMLERVVDLGEGREIPISEMVFAPSDTLVTVTPGDTAAILTLAFDDGSRRIVQRYRFESDTYVVGYALELDSQLDGVLMTSVSPRLLSNEKDPEDDYNQMRAVARIGDEVLSKSAEDVAEEPVSRGGAVGWGGIRSKYFLAIVLAPEETDLSAVSIAGSETDTLPELRVSVTSPVTDGVSAHRLFLGPQEYGSLSQLNRGLDEVNQYGWSWIRWMITPFAKLIVVVMLWLHQWIPSYGLVLVVFAVGVRLLMWPLTAKSFRSIQAMQKLQPEIQQIRERHKEDPQKMQKETMRLYREKKVNPLGGCLPNLIPMPILFALFFVFQSTIEFRGQPFLWLADLAQPDPVYILPVLMGGSMFLSSKLMQTDPKMSAMTYVMPVVLTFVFLNLAAGLVLYYTLSNILTFGQQWLLRRGTDDGTPEETDGGA